MHASDGVFGSAKLHVAVPPEPVRKNVTSGLTCALQPGAPNGVRSSGSGPNGDVVRLRPSAMIATSVGRLFTFTFSVVPSTGRLVAVCVLTGIVPAQPRAKKP